MIFKSYGFKIFDVGDHELSVGGNFFYQTGMHWNHSQTVFSPPTSTEDTVYTLEPTPILLESRGALRNGDMWSVNLSAGWRFPLGLDDVRGLFRIESYNVINRQQQVSTNGETGTPRRSRRSFQRPRTFRVLLGLEF